MPWALTKRRRRRRRKKKKKKKKLKPQWNIKNFKQSAKSNITA
jgi:hypothetical protein